MGEKRYVVGHARDQKVDIQEVVHLPIEEILTMRSSRNDLRKMYLVIRKIKHLKAFKLSKGEEGPPSRLQGLCSIRWPGGAFLGHDARRDSGIVREGTYEGYDLSLRLKLL